MTHTFEYAVAPTFPALGVLRLSNAKELFKQRFRCSLAQCVRRGFHVEECFGVIWEETLEGVELSCREQNELYPELIEWARGWIQ